MCNKLKGLQIKSSLRFHLTQVRMVIINKTGAGKDMGKDEHCTRIIEFYTSEATGESVM